jgi:hypothetical protein
MIFLRRKLRIPNHPSLNLTKIETHSPFYLGEVTDTLRTPRKRIITELEKKGFSVITGVPPPDEADAHENATKKSLQKADLAIHLLDEYPGREIIGAPDNWYPKKQTEMALDSEIFTNDMDTN